jgi:hypothetical protein
LRGAVSDEFCASLPKVRDPFAAPTGWRLDRLNALTKPIANTRPQRLDTVEAAAAPCAARVQPALVASQRTLRARSASKASAAR